MKSNTKIEIEYTPDDIKAILTKIVEKENPGFEVESIYFKIGAEYDPSDWQSRYPPTDVLENAKITMRRRTSKFTGSGGPSSA